MKHQIWQLNFAVGYKCIFIFNSLCGIGHVHTIYKKDCSRCLLQSTSSCKHCIVQIFILWFQNWEQLKANLVTKGQGESPVWLLKHMVPLLLSETKQNKTKNLAAHKKCYKTSQYSFFPSHQKPNKNKVQHP